jgi:CHAT domain-containing protein
MTVVEITVQRKLGDTWPVVLERNQTGELPLRAEGELDLGAGWREQLLSLALDPLAYGTVLGKALFREAVRDAFVTARNESGDDLRTLFVVEDEELKPLHWERLCAPIRTGGKWSLLGTDQRSVFSLYLPSLADRRFPAIGRRDLRALVLVANPPDNPPKEKDYGLDRFDESVTVAGIRAALGDLPHDLLASAPGAIGRPTLDELVARITGGSYTLLHVVAHGWYDDSSGETTLYLLDDSGQVAPVAASILIERLEEVQGKLGLPRLTFLATCESASSEAERAGALGGLAQRLVRDLGLPAVVAMTQKVSVDTATALAREFYVRLRDHGEIDRALVQAAAGLAAARDITVPALYSRLAGRPLFSDTPDRELTDSEVEFGLSRLETLLPERAPVLQDEFAVQAERLRGMLGAGRANLSKAAQDEWKKAEESINALGEEALDLSFPALALGKEPPRYDSRCPFPGLLAFGARFATSGRPEDDDRRFFFGREQWVKTLADKLQAYPFVAVLGGSGSGKSSLVLAGLVPALEKTYPGLRTAYMTPGSDPLARLDAALGTGASDKQSERGDAVPPPDADKAPSILVVDQFEELFRLTQDDNRRQEFVKRLLELTKQRFVIFTMRADFWGDCFPYPALRDAMLAHQVPIIPMTSAELRSAMEQQAAAVGLRFEADLSNTILDAVEGEPGAMPLLQHLLLEMWKRRHGRWLRASEYRVLGGIQQAIAHTADGIYAALSPAEQATVRNVFVRLTRLDGGITPGLERRNTRRRTEMAELIPAGQDPATVRSLVHRLADARLVVISSAEEVEVAHEALIRYWPALQEWIEQDRQNLLLRDEMSQAAEAWERTGRDDYLRHQGGRLRQVMALRTTPAITLNSRELAYIRACEERAQSVFRITIRRKLHDGWPVVVDSTPAGASLPIRAVSKLQIDGAFLTDLEHRELDRLAYGTLLGHQLFQGDAYTTFIQALGAADERLRVTLAIEDLDLKSLKWECLCGPLRGGAWGPLALEESISYSFHVPSSASYSLPPISREELRALLLVANPADLEKFGLVRLDTQAEVEKVRRAMRNVPCDVLAEDSNAVGPPTLEALCQRLVAQRYDLLHIIAHGYFKEDVGQSLVWLSDSDGYSDPVSADRLAKRLGATEVLPRCVYLGFVESASSSADALGQGFAQRFVRDLGVPAVLGAADKLTMNTYTKSLRPFYRSLLNHGFVDKALAEVRTASSDRPDADCLVLYSRLRDGQLFPELAPAAPSGGIGTTLEITIFAGGTEDNVWPVSVEYSPGGEWLAVRREGSLQLDQTKLANIGDPRDYGVVLGRTLLQGAVGDVWKELRNGGPLRIALCVEPAELAELHWEWLCAPIDDEDWRFLAEVPDAFFSLHENSAVAAPTRLRERSHLTALTLVVAGDDLTRYGLAPIDAAAVHASLARAMTDLPFEAVALTSPDESSSTLERLRARYRTGRFDILHIVAHVRRVLNSDEYAVFLRDDDNHTKPLVFGPSRPFPLLAGVNELPQFAFLCPPEGAEPADIEALGALAREFVDRTGMLAALAFTAPISMELSEAFATVFYRQLRTHGEVDRALNEACVALADRPGFAPPALYTRLKGRRLFYEA